MSSLKVFVSYAHENVEYKNDLKKHCALFEEDGDIELWTDDAIRAGDKFDDRIKEEILVADIAILLLSSTYWSKEYIKNIELPLILEQEESRGMVIIPILINGERKIKRTKLNGRSLIPVEDNMLKAIDDFEDKEKAWDIIYDEIDKKLDDYDKNKEIEKNIEQKGNTEKVEKKRPKVCIYTATPLNSNIDYNIGKIINIFRKYSIELHHKVLNEDELLDTYDFDLNIIFTKSSGKKIIIENEFFIKKTITIKELEENVNIENTIVLLDKEIEDTSLHTIKVEINKVTKFLKSYLHKHFQDKTGKAHYHELLNPLPYLIDKKNLIHFVGRSTDIENIIRKVLTLKDENMILNIKGSGGIGKTAIISKIAIEIAKRGKFKDGIEFIQCEFIKDYDNFENKITFSFGMDNAINFKEQLKEMSLGKDRLIILDNVETLLHLEDWIEIKELIKYVSDHATIVLTSREKLNEDYEDVYELRPLTTDEAEKLFTELYFIKAKDIKVLRQKILEEYLNNNPLAIKLVTKNLPKGKNIQSLLDELQTNFFDITSDDLERIFEEKSDLNIERTRSLFHSINYSYNKLNDKEKLALETLSLFPDGLHLESFVMFYNKDVKGHKMTKNGVNNRLKNFSDRDIKSLEDKSLIIISNQFISLQSIIGRFADYKFSQRSDDGKRKFYERAYNYNKFLTTLTNNNNLKSSTEAQIFDRNKNNFIKSLEYLSFMKINNDFYRYLILVTSDFSIYSAPNKKIIFKLKELEKLLDNQVVFSTFFEIILLHIRYYYGEFNKVFSELREKYPLAKLKDIEISDEKINNLVIRKIKSIYTYEGYPYEVLQGELKDDTINHTLPFLLGDYKIASYIKRNLKESLYGFGDYELALNINTLDIDNLIKYIKSIYKTQHIEKVQTTYTLAKADISKVKTKDIAKLVVTNPFSNGLKSLLFAMKTVGVEAKEKYENAIRDLYHIRYYHVEAILIYCKFLKEISDLEYEEWLQKGKDLAREHKYRYLLHQYICMENDEYLEYDENNYPLPEKLDYAQILKNYN